MLRAMFQNNRLFVHSSVTGRFYSMTVDELNDLKLSIDGALAEREKFLAGEWEGPKGKLD